MNAFFKRILPQWIQRWIYRFFWNPVRALYWSALRLGYALPSGLTITVKNRSDWVIYNEIFAGREYDAAIHFALNRWRPMHPFQVVDLGANVGYFTLRCADQFLRRCQDQTRLQITAIEAVPAVFKELKRRVAAQSQLLSSVRFHHGLVGRREGVAYIATSHIHYGNSFSDVAKSGSVRVPFLDLAKIFPAAADIDLLKCDIEGAEFEFVENYRDFLRKFGRRFLSSIVTAEIPKTCEPFLRITACRACRLYEKQPLFRSNSTVAMRPVLRRFASGFFAAVAPQVFPRGQ